MERVLWTDERLDDMVARNESQFELLLTEIRDLRAETRTEMREMRAEFAAEMRETRRQMLHGGIALFSAQIATFAAIIAHGL